MTYTFENIIVHKCIKLKTKLVAAHRINANTFDDKKVGITDKIKRLCKINLSLSYIQENKDSD